MPFELVSNNNAEAQFKVIKDKILMRIKEYNVVALISKLTAEFCDHYQKKLLSVATGSDWHNDGHCLVGPVALALLN